MLLSRRPLTNTRAGCPLQNHPKAQQSTTESRKSSATTWSPYLAGQPHLKGRVVDPMLTQVNDRFLAS